MAPIQLELTTIAGAQGYRENCALRAKGAQAASPQPTAVAESFPEALMAEEEGV